jgi:hypothetical protein
MAAFGDNDVDAEVLAKLTDDDLMGIGVTSVGHRRKLLAAIASFGAAIPLRPAPRRSTAPERSLRSDCIDPVAIHWP